MLKNLITPSLLIASIFIPHNSHATTLLDGKYSYIKKNGRIELSGNFIISSIVKSGNSPKYKAEFSGYYSKGDMPNICNFEDNLTQVANNVYSMKSNKDNDIKYNLILVFQGKNLISYATDDIEGCGMNAELSVPGNYQKIK
jgi:hypothetical protein